MLQAIARDITTGADYITSAARQMPEPDKRLILERVQQILQLAQDFCAETLEPPADEGACPTCGAGPDECMHIR
jgi:hypothetical protein